MVYLKMKRRGGGADRERNGETYVDSGSPVEVEKDWE